MKKQNTQQDRREVTPYLDDTQLMILDAARAALEDCWRKANVMPLIVSPLEDIEDGNEGASAENTQDAIQQNRIALIEQVRFTFAQSQREHATVILANNYGRLIGLFPIGKGSATSCPISFRDIAGLCWHHAASFAVAFHNHPSGNSRPSDADLAVTQQLGEFLNRCEVMLLDHIVVGASGYSSVSWALATGRGAHDAPAHIAPLLWGKS